MCGGNVTIDLVDSETGVNYYLRNDVDDAIISGPIAGTGNTIVLNTASISSTTTYNVYAEKQSALTLDGTDDKLVVLDNASFDVGTATDFTLEAKVKFTVSQQDYTGIIAKGNSGAFYQLVLYNNKLGAEISNGAEMIGVEDGLLSSTILNDGNWHHVAMVVNRASNNARLYVDGIEEGNATDPLISDNLNSSEDLLMGAERLSIFHFKGQLDEIRIWNTARSSSEITSDMSECLSSTEAGLVAYYNFENGQGTSSLIDYTNNNNGNLINMNLSTAWITGAINCKCVLEMTAKSTITVNSIASQTVTAAQSLLCNSGSTTIDLASSETTVEYYLRNDLNDIIVDGPLTGTGAAITFNTGNISATTTYNVLAERPQPNTALSFDGANDYISIPSGISIANSSFTIEFWAKRNGSGTRDFIMGQTGDNNQVLHIGFRDNDAFTFAFYGDDLDITSTATIDGNYHHWTCVYNAGISGIDRYIYLDGVLVANDDAIGDYSGSGEFVIGKNTFTGDNFPGALDEVRIWSKALTQTEIESRMNSCLTGTESELIAYYNMNDITGATLNDVSGNGLNGTIMNMDPANVVNGIALSRCFYCNSEMTQTATVTINNTPVIVSVTQNGNTLTADASGATYKWVDCNNGNALISGEISQSYTAASSGDYAVIVTQNACIDTSACIDVLATGIMAGTNTNSKIEVYPNPNKGAFVIKSTIEGTYSIVNNVGQVVQTVTLDSSDNFSVEINNLESGLYFIIGFKDNVVTQQKIVVAK